MVAVAMKVDLRTIHEILQTKEGRDHFRSHYPEEMEWYERALEEGVDRSMIKAALMAMWQQELERNAESICERFAPGS